MKILKNKWNLIFLFVGVFLLSWFLYKFGANAIEILRYNINYFYFSLFALTTFLSFVPHTMRFKSILDSYGKNVNLLTLIKHNISCFAVSYITPVSRLGGEPVRIYMLKEETGVDYVVGTSTVILDKFVEILGSSLYGILGLIFLIFLVGIPLLFRWLFGFFVFLGCFFIFIFYIRTVNQKPTLSKIFYFLKLDRIKKLTGVGENIIEIECIMGDFFKNHKKAFLKSFIYYSINGVFFIVMFKFLFLSIGFNASVVEIILAVNVWGLMNFAPSPSSLGFLEAGQSGLLHALSGNGSNGLAMALLLRVVYLSVTCLGLLIIYRFGYKKIKKISSINLQCSPQEQNKL